MAYSAEDLKAMVRDAIKNPATLYQQRFINYRGRADGVPYTEIVAQELLTNIYKLYTIPCITREASYKTKGHAELAKAPKTEYSTRKEEWIAMAMYGKKLDHIGVIVDYQVPLKNKATDQAGKIDLLSYDQCGELGECAEYGSKSYIVELKKPESKETLLRCVLEAFTYSRTVNAPKLRRDFNMLPATPLIPAVLIFNCCRAYDDFNADRLNSSMVKELMRELGVELYAISDVLVRGIYNISCLLQHYERSVE